MSDNPHNYRPAPPNCGTCKQYCYDTSSYCEWPFDPPICLSFGRRTPRTDPVGVEMHWYNLPLIDTNHICDLYEEAPDA